MSGTFFDVAVQPNDELGPRLFIDQISAEASPQSGRWCVAWRIESHGDQPIGILSGRLPHSQFRAAERELVPHPEISAKGSVRLEFTVSCSESPGTVIENAFLILRVICAEDPWRVLARLRVKFNEAGQPWTVTESVTKHRIGFSSEPAGN